MKPATEEKKKKKEGMRGCEGGVRREEPCGCKKRTRRKANGKRQKVKSPGTEERPDTSSSIGSCNKSSSKISARDRFLHLKSLNESEQSF